MNLLNKNRISYLFGKTLFVEKAILTFQIERPGSGRLYAIKINNKFGHQICVNEPGPRRRQVDGRENEVEGASYSGLFLSA